MRRLKCVFLRICELFGLFRITERIYAGRLHILCYHGFSLDDEWKFRPQLFIRPETFAGRLARIRRAGFHVLSLEEGIARLRQGTLPAKAVVITIDDGFYSTYSVAAPLLRQYAMPSTVYVTSYYMSEAVPVFRLAVQYLFWRAGSRALDCAELRKILGNEQVIDSREDDQQALMWKLIAYGEELQSEEGRQDLIRKIGKLLELNVELLYGARLLTLMSGSDVAELPQLGMDVQLHTHRHRFPADKSRACFEIDLNRTQLQQATGRRADHLCYPSGIFSVDQWPWLEEWGIKSATTCLPGLNRWNTPVYGLRRFLDSEDILEVEFRAEMAGFSELLRSFKRPFVGS